MHHSIAPSMLSANFSNLEKDIELVNSSEANLFHLDIMDGVFVPNISYGFPVVKAIASKAKKPLDAHLMIVDPDRYLENFAQLGVNYLSVHYEACTHLHRTIQKIKSLGMKAGVALNPHTPVETLTDILSETDFILIMSVNPGFGGQSFIENSYSKIKRLKKMIEQRSLNTLIEVDGGVNKENAPLLFKSGANILVAGNSVFASSDPAKAITQLKNAL
ncbi:MAG: ribulose-phosphate 3-epimerase [Bacteroidales bacterium]|nr:ribulose-phosphate 3-epimerase [Bacteroidales bacterium]MDD4655856.1 ribulose-phosphate 3-epimerase [Bacteroidales bacterium]